MTKPFHSLILASLLAAPAVAHDWAGIGDSRFGAVEAVVPPDWRDMDSTGAASESLGRRRTISRVFRTSSAPAFPRTVHGC